MDGGAPGRKLWWVVMRKKRRRAREWTAGRAGAQASSTRKIKHATFDHD